MLYDINARWYREVAGRLQPVESSPEAWWWAGGAALCLPRARPQHAGAWLCKAYNVFGDATAQLRIHVTDTLTVTVGPSVLVRPSSFNPQRTHSDTQSIGRQLYVCGWLRAGGGDRQHGAAELLGVGPGGAAGVAARRGGRGRRRRAAAALRQPLAPRPLPVLRATTSRQRTR